MTDALVQPPAPTTVPSFAPAGTAPFPAAGSSPRTEPGAVGAPATGTDLARIPLRQAHAAVKARGQATRPHRRPGPTPRDPAEFAVVLQYLMAERAWDMPAADSTILAQWTAIATAVSPTLLAHVHTGYDTESGRLDFSYTTQLRLLTTQITTTNDHVGSSAVRALRVLPPGALDTIPLSPTRLLRARPPSRPDR